MTAHTPITTPAAIFPGRFANKVAIVTGAAQGIGRAVALRLAAEGGKVVAVDRSEIVHELAEAGALPVIADLEVREGAQTAIGSALDAHGRLDILINNVGGAIRMQPFERFTPDEIEAEIRRSLFPTLGAAARRCRRCRPGAYRQRVVSRHPRRPPHPLFGGEGRRERADREPRLGGGRPRRPRRRHRSGGTEAPQRRIPRGPGATAAEAAAWSETVVAQTKASSLMGRYGTADEQAAPILFLASDEASYLTGVTMPVSGGDLG